MSSPSSWEQIVRAFRRLPGSPITVAAGGLAIAGTLWIVKDYHEWISFGTGGTPSTLAGYLKMRKWWFKRLWNGDDLRNPSALPKDGPRYLLRPVPRREGGRPELMSRTLPHRQKPEALEPQTKDVLFSLPTKLQSQRPDILVLAPSKTEGGSADAIYAKADLASLNPEAASLQYEIAHVHPSDNSLHVMLAPFDARTLIETYWAESFPVHEIAPPGWVMVYAPRDKREVELVEDIMKAAVAWVTGVTI
ncbi:hypothetical protein BCR39DRAFT_499139 [Naematelia encephala]|uniref:Luciferase domain-containing protein n=1 Tax=Naematelia encephala TaxID=71784 RepID=A0A1Y2ASV9_9TREE|nr:hypothetical protein BCR39DRAFT_499139 [Naematelia encephala]